MTHGEVLLEVRGLRTTFPSDAGPVRAVDGVSLSLRRGERLGLVGESGSGKSVTAMSIMGLVAPPARLEGEVLYGGVDLVRASSRQRQEIRGSGIGMVFQNPLNCLNPAMTVGAQIDEAILIHEGVSRREARDRAVESLARVGIPSPARSAREYPHRFSGGMRQRAMIAMALSCRPALLIADEPTTALDVTIQAQIVDLLASISAEEGTAVILITHDLGLLAGFAERICVMYAGKIVEEGPVDTIYYGATHPYTWGLMSSLTRFDEPPRTRLAPISGNPPSAVFVPPGCRFHPRCRYEQEVCRRDVPDLSIHAGDDHPSACHFAGRLDPPRVLAPRLDRS